MIIDGYEADPDEVEAILAEDIDAEDRADPTLLYVRAAKQRALYTEVARRMGELCAEAAQRLTEEGGLSRRELADHLGVSLTRAQQLVAGARPRSAQDR